MIHCNCTPDGPDTYAVYEKAGGRLWRLTLPTWCEHTADQQRAVLADSKDALYADRLVTMTTRAAKEAAA